MSKSIKKINGFPIMDEKARNLLSSTKTDINSNFDKISTLFSTETIDNKVILKFNSIVIAEIPIGTISGDINYSISNNLDQNITSNGASSVVKDQPYTCSLTPKSGYKITFIKVTMNGEDITSSCVNGNNINIPKVTGSVIITAKSTQILNSFTITNNLSNATTSNTNTSIKQNSSYTATITPSKNYNIVSIIVSMGGTVLNDCVTNNVIAIAKVTGNIIIDVKTKLSENIQLLDNAVLLDGIKGLGSAGCVDIYGNTISVGDGIVDNIITYDGVTANLTDLEVVKYE